MQSRTHTPLMTGGGGLQKNNDVITQDFIKGRIAIPFLLRIEFGKEKLPSESRTCEFLYISRCHHFLIELIDAQITTNKRKTKC